MSIRYFYIISALFHVVLISVLLSITGSGDSPVPERSLIATIIRPENVTHINIPRQSPEVIREMKVRDGSKPPETIEGSGAPGDREDRGSKGVRDDMVGKDLRTAEKKAIEDVFSGQESVDELAKKGKEEHEMTFSTKEYKYLGYKARLKERIESIWQYPPEAVERELFADLYIRFTIERNGDLKDVKLIRTSGYKILDDAALKALRDAAPYWPLPEEWEDETFTITGHFIYTLSGYYIR